MGCQLLINNMFTRRTSNFRLFKCVILELFILTAGDASYHFLRNSPQIDYLCNSLFYYYIITVYIIIVETLAEIYDGNIKKSSSNQ